MFRIRASQNTRLISYSIRECDPCRKKLRHPGLDIAAPVLVLLTGREVRQFPHHHGFSEHHRQLVGNAWKVDDWLTELRPFDGVGMSKFECTPCDAYCAGRS